MPGGQKNAEQFAQKVRLYLDQVRHMIEVEKETHVRTALRLGLTRKTIARMCSRFQLKTQRTGPRSGAGHPEWKGGRIEDKNGYILVYSPGHPMARAPRKKYVFEHRLVMSQKLGRLLLPNEVVHHIDGNRKNNHPDNLILFQTNADHLRHELIGRCPKWTPEGHARILEGCRKPKNLSPEQKARNSEQARKRIANRLRSKVDGRLLPGTIDRPPSSADSTGEDPAS